MDSTPSTLSRRSRRRQKSRRKTILLTAASMMLIALGAVFLFLSPAALDKLKDTFTRTPATVADREVEALVARTPMLFTPAWGAIDADELKARLIAYERDMDLLADEATRRGIADDEGQAQTSLEAFERGFTSPAELDAILAERGISREQLAGYFERAVLISKLADELVGEGDIPEGYVEEYFEAHRASFTSSDAKRVSHILFDADNLQGAQEVAEQIEAGADFATLAREHSKDLASAERGGDIGWSTGTYPAPFQEAVDALGVGEVSEPVATKYGIHLITVTDTRTGTSDFEHVRARVTAEALAEMRGRAITELLSQLKGGRP